MRLIDADALLERWCSEVCKPKPNCNEDCMIYDYLTMNFLSPTIEPVKRGKWIISSSNAEGVCTNCQYKIYGRPYNNTYLIVPYNYCPNCGARMREEVEE